MRNFPIKSFYSSVTGECYTFYRQGMVFTVSSVSCSSPQNRNNESLNTFADNELGPMYLLFDKALVTQSSGSIYFYKKNTEGKWEEYDKLEKMRG